jgi:hypothetical protein
MSSIRPQNFDSTQGGGVTRNLNVLVSVPEREKETKVYWIVYRDINRVKGTQAW